MVICESKNNTSKQNKIQEVIIKGKINENNKSINMSETFQESKKIKEYPIQPDGPFEKWNL